jgi:hypothetical protein
MLLIAFPRTAASHRDTEIATRKRREVSDALPVLSVPLCGSV